MIKLWADFNARSENGLRLNCNGTIHDLTRQNIQLKEGDKILLWDEDIDDNNNEDNLIVFAVAHYDNKNNYWEGVFDWSSIMHESDLKK